MPSLNFGCLCYLCFSYHQKVPIDVPQLELKATYGLVSPEEYNGCTMSPLWTVDVYDKFNCITSDRVDTVKFPVSLAVCIFQAFY